jgi:hypothetical protein
MQKTTAISLGLTTKMHEITETMTQEERGTKLRGGRPPSVTITPEDAKIVREAAKLAARYYGMRLQDLGPKGGWITSAMRTKAAMSTETALALLKLIVHPKPGLVATRRPQGTPTRDVLRRFVDIQNETGQTPPPESYDEVKDDVGARFMAFANMAGLLLQKYQMPIPGTAVFVMPGTSRLVARKLIEVLPEGSVKKQRLREIEDVLARYFELGERPLRAELGKELIPRLTILSLAENLSETARFLTEDGWPPDAFTELETWARDVIRSERRRRRGQRGGLRKATTSQRKKTSATK